MFNSVHTPCMDLTVLPTVSKNVRIHISESTFHAQ